MSEKSRKDRLGDLAELIDPDDLPDLVEDDSPATVIDLGETLDLIDDSGLDDGGFVDDVVTIDDEYGDDDWIDEGTHSTPGAIDLSTMDDIVMDLDADAAGEGIENENDFLDDLIDDVDLSAAEEDDGAEGPISSETFEIDPASWDALDDEEELEEDILDTMSRLELSLDTEEDVALPIGGGTPFLGTVDISFIGPKVGEVYTALFHGGSPLGIGDELYVYGADQMLHEVPRSGFKDLIATSVIEHRGTLFVGTAGQGAFRSPDRGRTVYPLNSWYTQGLAEGATTRSGACSTSFTLSGQRAKSGFRLLGWTGEGQLYVSTDLGGSWSGPLLKGWRCETLRTERNGELTVVLAASNTVSGTLLETRDFQQFTPIAMPSALAANLSSTNCAFDVAPGLIAACCATPGRPLFLSSDEGGTWQEAPGVSGVTAVVIDQDAPDWLAVSMMGRRGAPVICISENRGKSWHEACTITAPSAHGKIAGVTALILKDDGTRSLMALTDDGVYLIQTVQKKLTH